MFIALFIYFRIIKIKNCIIKARSLNFLKIKIFGGLKKVLKMVAIIAVIIVAIGIGFYMCNDTYQVEEIQEAVMI